MLFFNFGYYFLHSHFTIPSPVARRYRLTVSKRRYRFMQPFLGTVQANGCSTVHNTVPQNCDGQVKRLQVKFNLQNPILKGSMTVTNL